jgi:hypothetical protein
MGLRLCTDQDGPARVIVKGSHCVSAETIRRIPLLLRNSVFE